MGDCEHTIGRGLPPAQPAQPMAELNTDDDDDDDDDADDDDDDDGDDDSSCIANTWKCSYLGVQHIGLEFRGKASWPRAARGKGEQGQKAGNHKKPPFLIGVNFGPFLTQIRKGQSPIGGAKIPGIVESPILALG